MTLMSLTAFGANPVHRQSQMVFLMLIPSGLDPKQLESDVRGMLPNPEDCEVSVQAV